VRVSQYVEFFVADDDEMATAVLPTGPGRALTTVSGAYFYVDDAMTIWEHVADARTGRWEAAINRPRMVACGGNDTSAVFAMPADLAATLARAEPGSLRSIAEAWQAAVGGDGDLDSDTAWGVVTGVAALAREAVRSGHRVYGWASD
jgi:hypothetical protein